MSQKIDESGIAFDIQFGMTDAELMAKYGLQESELQRIVRRLADTGAIEASDLDERLIPCEVELSEQGIRESDRVSADFPLPIYELQRPQNYGVVRDISDQGIGVTGLTAEVNEIRTFVIPVDRLFDIAAIVFRCACRWTRRDESDGTRTAGFAVTEVLSGDFEALQRLMNQLSARKS
jgi:hypothetical protein